MLDLQMIERPVSDPDESPIFIIGTGRSGTTLLRQMLTAHPRIHITHEATFYTYERYAPAYASGTEVLERYFETFSFAWLRVDPDEVRAELPRNLPRERIAEGYRAIMRCKARQLGKPRFGEKNPLDTQNLARIFKDFKDPRVIYIMRDPRPTVHSFNRVPFGTSSILLNSFVCSIHCHHVRPYLDRILEVRLEDLSADPRRVMGSILRFVGEPWDEAVLDHVNHAAADDMPPVPWFEGATRERPSHKTSDGGWRDRLDPAWIRLIERINRKGMAHYGYEPVVLEREPSYVNLVVGMLRDLPGAFATGYRLLVLWLNLYLHFYNMRRLDPQRGLADVVGLNPAAWRHYPGFRMPQVPRLAGPFRELAVQPRPELAENLRE